MRFTRVSYAKFWCRIVSASVRLREQELMYARGLQRQGDTKRAFELYPQVPKKDANQWISHLSLARIDSNKGDFSAAERDDASYQRSP